jgi:thiol-disulfide isomerase/thioredoxin
MNNKIIKIFALYFLIVGPMSLFAEAKPAPAFTLPDIQGNSHSLADYSGKLVVLEWLSHSCPFVVKFYASGKMQALQEKWTGKGVIWLSINSTNPSHRTFYAPAAELAKANEVGSLATAILHDHDGAVGRAYGARTTPHMYIIDGEGNIVYAGAIDSIRSANAADIPNATNYVDEALMALISGEPVSVTSTPPYGCSIKY